MQKVNGCSCRTCKAIRVERGLEEGQPVELFSCHKNAPRPAVMPIVSDDMDFVTVWPDIDNPDAESCEEYVSGKPQQQVGRGPQER